MKREYIQWHSPILGRTMEMLVFGTSGERWLVFPTRRERFYEYENHGMVHSLRHWIKDGQIQLYCVDGVDEESLYCFTKPPEERIERHLQYERYIREEVIPLMDWKNPGTPMVSHGCSFGAYHAVTMALRSPSLFHRVLAFSGRYDLTLDRGPYHTLFHGFYNERLASIMPTDFVPKLEEGPQLRQIRRLRLILVVGDEDAFYENNCHLADAFSRLEIPHQLHLWCGEAHRFGAWRQMVRVYRTA